MKVKYEYVNETVEIEVDEKWAAVLEELDRKEYNNNKKHSRRHYSLDAVEESSSWLIDDEDPEEMVIDLINYHKMENVIPLLCETQRHLVEALMLCGISQAEYAYRNGISRAAVTQRLNRIKNKLKKISD